MYSNPHPDKRSSVKGIGFTNTEIIIQPQNYLETLEQNGNSAGRYTDGDGI